LLAELEPFLISRRPERVPDTGERLHVLTSPDFPRRSRPDALLLRREPSVASVARDLVRQLGAPPRSLRLSQPQKKRAIRQAAEPVNVDAGNVLALRDVEEIQHGEMLLDRHLLRVHSRFASSRPAQAGQSGARTLESGCLHSPRAPVSPRAPFGMAAPLAMPLPWPCSSTR